MAMQPGTIIKLVDTGEEATVVYHGLDGYGAKIGHGPLSGAELAAICSCGLMTEQLPANIVQPDVMLSGIEFEVLRGEPR